MIADPASPLNAPPSPQLSALRHPVVLLLTGAVITVACWPAARPAGPSSPSMAAAAPADEATARQEAAGVLSAFLAAATDEARAALILDAARLRPALTAYYRGREAEPLQASDFRPAPWHLTGTMGPVGILEAGRTRSLPPVVACVVQQNGRWLLDWEIFVQSGDGLLGCFIDQPVEGLHAFRVNATRTSAAGQPLVLSLEDPFTRRTLTLPVERPDLVALFKADLPSGKSRPATVELGWMNHTTTGSREPRLARHLCWGYQGLNGTPSQNAAILAKTPDPAATIQTAVQIAVGAPAAPGLAEKSEASPPRRRSVSRH